MMGDENNNGIRGNSFIPADYTWRMSSASRDNYDGNDVINDEDDADNHDGLHGGAKNSMNSRPTQFMHKVTRFIQHRSRNEKIVAAVVAFILIVAVVHHRTGPSHALNDEERELRFLARNELDAGHVPADEAYVTTVSSDNEATGAFALSASLISVRSTRMLRVLVTSDVSISVRTQLGSLPNVAAVTMVEPIPKDDASFSSIGSAEWRNHFTKLRVWQLTSFNRIVYLDSRSVILRNLDGLFQQCHPEDSKVFTAYVTNPANACSMAGGDARGIDTSIMVIKPSRMVFERLVNKAHSLASEKNAPSFNVADVILSAFDEDGMWIPLRRPDYGFSAHEICQCTNPNLMYTARFLRDTISKDPLTGPSKNDEEPQPSPDYASCLIQYQNQWKRHYKQAMRYLL